MIFCFGYKPRENSKSTTIKIYSKNKLIYVFTTYVNSEVKKFKINEKIEKIGNHSAVEQESSCISLY